MTEEHTHISDEMWKKYAQGTLSTKEEEKLYTHVGCCTYCAERFANIVETDFFAEPPSSSLRRDCRAEPEGGCSGGSNSEKDI